MFHARAFSGLVLAVSLLAGCETAETTRVAGAPTELNVVDVTVAATADTEVRGRAFARSPAQIVADVEAAVTAELTERSDAAGTPVTVSISLGAVELANVAERALAQASSITAVVAVTGVQGGTIVPAQEIAASAGGLRLPGAVGTVTTRSVEQDYSDTVRGFATTLGNVIFPEL